jgi:glucose-1-phosphate cytidylyltransferase
VREYIGDETFCFTYGDGVSDVDITALIAFHREQGKIATLTATQQPGRFGAFSLKDSETTISSFHEKPKGDGAWINGGFFVLEPAAIDYVESDDTVWERGPMERLARNGELAAFRHGGFWQPMDTLRDKHVLEELWASGEAPWKQW